MANEPTSKADFAPADLMDGRAPGSWETRYPRKALIRIRCETVYLLSLLISIPSIIIYNCPNASPSGLTLRQCIFLAISGGVFGGTLFAMKWLYHSVAKNIWTEDRCLWRIFTPLLSGGLAFVFFVLITSKSGIVNIFDPKAWESGEAIFGFCFLVGYFSDPALAKLAEVAGTLFGNTKQ